LHATGVIQPRKVKVVYSMHPQFDPSKHCSFYSNAQGHDIEECVALKHKSEAFTVQMPHQSEALYITDAPPVGGPLHYNFPPIEGPLYYNCLASQRPFVNTLQHGTTSKQRLRHYL
ncbi:hypothetical protein HAX54_043178, partial [Datura stramonium]|nr:hypothetical protein [Datura stramonium]